MTSCFSQLYYYLLFLSILFISNKWLIYGSYIDTTTITDPTISSLEVLCDFNNNGNFISWSSNSITELLDNNSSDTIDDEWILSNISIPINNNISSSLLSYENNNCYLHIYLSTNDYWHFQEEMECSIVFDIDEDNAYRTYKPTVSPTSPTSAPSNSPSKIPTNSPSPSPTEPSEVPTESPTVTGYIPPTRQPTPDPSDAPSQPPSSVPSNAPSLNPSNAPSLTPTQPPSITPSQPPSESPSQPPSMAPSVSPSQPPSMAPSVSPSQPPSSTPTMPPTNRTGNASVPTAAPSFSPSQPPSLTPSVSPSLNPSLAPSVNPTYPTNAPSFAPSQPPSIAPSTSPSQPPSSAPSMSPLRVSNTKIFEIGLLHIFNINNNNLKWLQLYDNDDGSYTFNTNTGCDTSDSNTNGLSSSDLNEDIIISSIFNTTGTNIVNSDDQLPNNGNTNLFPLSFDIKSNIVETTSSLTTSITLDNNNKISVINDTINTNDFLITCNYIEAWDTNTVAPSLAPVITTAVPTTSTPSAAPTGINTTTPGTPSPTTNPPTTNIPTLTPTLNVTTPQPTVNPTTTSPTAAPLDRSNISNGGINYYLIPINIDVDDIELPKQLSLTVTISSECVTAPPPTASPTEPISIIDEWELEIIITMSVVAFLILVAILIAIICTCRTKRSSSQFISNSIEIAGTTRDGNEPSSTFDMNPFTIDDNTHQEMLVIMRNDSLDIGLEE